jgi:hypothetical protein
MIRHLLAGSAQIRKLPDDVAPDELAGYCLHALAAASSLPPQAGVRRLSPSRWLGCVLLRVSVSLHSRSAVSSDVTSDTTTGSFAFSTFGDMDASHSQRTATAQPLTSVG